MIRKWLARRKARRLLAHGQSAAAAAVIFDAYGKAGLDVLRRLGRPKQP